MVDQFQEVVDPESLKVEEVRWDFSEISDPKLELHLAGEFPPSAALRGALAEIAVRADSPATEFPLVIRFEQRWEEAARVLVEESEKAD